MCIKRDDTTKRGNGIVSPVDHLTEWVNNLQIVEKPNGKLRICLDPKPLNECIQREHFLIPTIDGFTSRLTGKRVFSVLDLSSGFLAHGIGWGKRGPDNVHDAIWAFSI